MAEGYVIDVNQHSVRSVSTWVEGAPEKSFWLGLKLGNRAQYKVQTWRCGRCGFLESYAKG
jgi:hypothetical protein